MRIKGKQHSPLLLITFDARRVYGAFRRNPAACRRETLVTTLPSESLPPGLAGLEQRDVVGPTLLPATDKGGKTERVGLR